jgi:hypothetical protein
VKSAPSSVYARTVRGGQAGSFRVETPRGQQYGNLSYAGSARISLATVLDWTLRHRSTRPEQTASRQETPGQTTKDRPP